MAGYGDLFMSSSAEWQIHRTGIRFTLLSAHNPCTGSFAAARLLLERCPLSQDPMQVARLLWKIWAKDYIWKCCTKHNSVSADSPIFRVCRGPWEDVGLSKPLLQQWILRFAFIRLFLWFSFVSEHYKSL